MNKKRLRHVFNEVIRHAENDKCNNMHHKKSHQHAIGDTCPVEYELSRNIYLLRQYMKSNDI